MIEVRVNQRLIEDLNTAVEALQWIASNGAKTGNGLYLRNTAQVALNKILFKNKGMNKVPLLTVTERVSLNSNPPEDCL